MENGEGPVGEGNQHAAFHVPAVRERVKEMVSDSEIRDTITQNLTSLADNNLHQTEHRVFEFDGVETLLPVSNS